MNKATGSHSTVPGGLRNTADGYASFAAGHYTGVLHDGVFVWQDHRAGPSDTLKSTAPNQFFARASGGFKSFTTAATDTSTPGPN